MTYYKIIGGVRYDRRLLEEADACTTQGRNEYRISLAEIQYLFRLAADAGAMTAVEQATLRYIARHYRLTAKAKKWLTEQLSPSGEDDVQASLQQVLRQQYRLTKLRYEISTATVQQYLKASGARDWEAVLRSAVDAYLHGSQGQLSFAACVARQEGIYLEGNESINRLKSYLDRGTLHLIPSTATPTTAWPYDLPPAFDPANFWTFVLQLPEFEPVEFFAFVHRKQLFQYSKGQFSRQAGLELTIIAAFRLARFDHLQWHLPADEVARQLALLPQQNFGNALFAALDTGIFNQESSLSFADFIRQETWPDPDTEISAVMRQYANTGKLHLIPIDYRAQTDSGTASFPVPEQVSFGLDGEWVFGLEMPLKTQVQLFLTTPREGNDGDMAWNNAFIDDPLTVAERLQQMVAEEFELAGLQLNIVEADFEDQRQTLGPDWRQLPGLVRQALNTLLHDYLSPNGVFNGVVNRESLDAAQFDNAPAYRAAVQALIRNYLRNGGTLALLPNMPEENVAPNGETVEQNWLFRAVLPELADHYFWIVVPRWPEEDQRPYNYIS